MRCFFQPVLPYRAFSTQVNFLDRFQLYESILTLLPTHKTKFPSKYQKKILES